MRVESNIFLRSVTVKNYQYQEKAQLGSKFDTLNFFETWFRIRSALILTTISRLVYKLVLQYLKIFELTNF